MMTIDALGKDGANILADLQHTSPAGGLCQSEWRDRTRLVPGDVVRDAAGWCVVGGISHDGVLGLSVVAVIDEHGMVWRHTLAACAGAEVRTDARVDPDTLHKLGELTPAAQGHAAEPPVYADQRAHDVAWMTAAERETHDRRAAQSAGRLARYARGDVGYRLLG